MSIKSLLKKVSPEIKLIWQGLDSQIFKKMQQESEKLSMPCDAVYKMGATSSYPERLMAFLAYDCQYIPKDRMDMRWSHFVNTADKIVLSVLAGKLESKDAVSNENIRKFLSKHVLYFDTGEVACESEIEVSDVMVRVVRRYILEYIIPCLEVDRWKASLQRTIGTLDTIKKIK